jgi:hypothetical protein
MLDQRLVRFDRNNKRIRLPIPLAISEVLKKQLVLPLRLHINALAFTFTRLLQYILQYTMTYPDGKTRNHNKAMSSGGGNTPEGNHIERMRSKERE